MAHTFHLLSVLVLHELTMVASSQESVARSSRFAFLVACLHIVSPAGIFLSAPYAESPFSFLVFLGYYFYAKALVDGQLKHFRSRRGMYMLYSGIIFGVATTFRGNGLINGLTFVCEAISSIDRIQRSPDIRSNHLALIAVIISGSLMAVIAGFPQYLAYSEYCYGDSEGGGLRPWCSSWVPSIYAWVQKEYW